jgi:hypothetical protein
VESEWDFLTGSLVRTLFYWGSNFFIAHRIGNIRFPENGESEISANKVRSLGSGGQGDRPRYIQEGKNDYRENPNKHTQQETLSARDTWLTPWRKCKIV